MTQPALPDPPEWAATKRERIAELERDHNWIGLASFAHELLSALAEAESALARWEFIAAERGTRMDEIQARAEAAEEQVAPLREALERIATPKRSDGTYNLSREACEQIARAALSPGGEAENAPVPGAGSQE